MRQQRANGLVRVVIMGMTLVMVAIIAGVIMHLVYTPRPDPTVATCPGGPGQEDDFLIDFYRDSDGRGYIKCLRDTDH